MPLLTRAPEIEEPWEATRGRVRLDPRTLLVIPVFALVFLAFFAIGRASHPGVAARTVALPGPAAVVSGAAVPAGLAGVPPLDRASAARSGAVAAAPAAPAVSVRATVAPAPVHVSAPALVPPAPVPAEAPSSAPTPTGAAPAPAPARHGPHGGGGSGSGGTSGRGTGESAGSGGGSFDTSG